MLDHDLENIARCNQITEGGMTTYYGFITRDEDDFHDLSPRVWHTPEEALKALVAQLENDSDEKATIDSGDIIETAVSGAYVTGCRGDVVAFNFD